MPSQTLAAKLGLREGMRAYSLDQPSHYHTLIADAPVIPSESPVDGANFVHVFSDRQDRLITLLDIALPTLADRGMLWISWPKKSSGKRTNLSMNVILRIGRAIGMVDIKICSVDETWSAVKFVYRRS